jgi:hypothetical protein
LSPVLPPTSSAGWSPSSPVAPRRPQLGATPSRTTLESMRAGGRASALTRHASGAQGARPPVRAPSRIQRSAVSRGVSRRAGSIDVRRCLRMRCSAPAEHGLRPAAGTRRPARRLV